MGVPLFNWKHHQIPVEVNGGIMFPPGARWEAKACVDRLKASGHEALASTYPGELGIFVQIGLRRME